MSEDARRTLAFVANRQATDVLAASTWANVLSLELAWFSPSDARRFIEACVAAALLDETPDGLRLAFPRQEVAVPRGFRPAPGALPEPVEPKNEAPADPFVALLDRIAAADGSRAEVMERVQAVQDRFGGKLSAEAAAVRVAVEAGLDVADEARAALGRIKDSA